MKITYIKYVMHNQIHEEWYEKGSHRLAMVKSLQNHGVAMIVTSYNI